MARVVRELLVQAPRLGVYAFLIDFNNLHHFFPGDVQGFRLESPSPHGTGAVSSFEVRLGKTLPGEMIMTGSLLPEAVTAIVKIGPLRWMLRYELQERGEACHIRMVSDYSVVGFLQRFLTGSLYAPAMNRWHDELVRRLPILE